MADRKRGEGSRYNLHVGARLMLWQGELRGKGGVDIAITGHLHVMHGHQYGKTLDQGALKGINLREQTEPKHRFSMIFADFADSGNCQENKSFGKCSLSQKTADLHRISLKTAGTRRKPQIGFCPLRLSPQALTSLTLSNVDLPAKDASPRSLMRLWLKPSKIIVSNKMDCGTSK